MIVDFCVMLLKWAFIFAASGIWYSVGMFINDFIPGVGTFLFLFIPILIGGCIYNKEKVSFVINILCSVLMTMGVILFLLWSADVI